MQEWGRNIFPSQRRNFTRAVWTRLHAALASTISEPICAPSPPAAARLLAACFTPAMVWMFFAVHGCVNITSQAHG